jgi:hypothetical protein
MGHVNILATRCSKSISTINLFICFKPESKIKIHHKKEALINSALKKVLDIGCFKIMFTRNSGIQDV